MVDKIYREPQKISVLFNERKLSCFGRYAFYIPKISQIVWGATSFPSRISVISSSRSTMEQLVLEDVARIRRANDTAEVIFSGPGRDGLGWRLDYYEDKYAKRDGALYSRSYIELGNNIFLLSAAKAKSESEVLFLERQFRRAKSIVLADHDIHADPGFCVEHGFIRQNTYDHQEIVAIGLHLPSYPDVKFSITSNKDAYADYSPEEFDGRIREELSLLSRIKHAKDEQGSNYPARVVLREGPRNVNHWKGEESLIRRADGTHDFEWAYVGRPGDVAYPPEFSVQMFTKVANNMIGAAEKASLTDDEAVALWDKLLSSLKFRVKVPGAPEGSYYFLPGEKTDRGAKP